MIRSFIHRGLSELWATDRSRRVRPDLKRRALRVLTVLHAAEDLPALRATPYRLHRLHGSGRYALDVNGPWRITFEWEDGDAARVDLEQYH